jgi:hypothetical protein
VRAADTDEEDLNSGAGGIGDCGQSTGGGGGLDEVDELDADDAAAADSFKLRDSIPPATSLKPRFVT